MKRGDSRITKTANHTETTGIRYGSGKLGSCSDVHPPCKLSFSICFYGARSFFASSLREENGMFDTDCALLSAIRRETPRPFFLWFKKKGDVQSLVIGVEMTDMMICVEVKVFETRL